MGFYCSGISGMVSPPDSAARGYPMPPSKTAKPPKKAEKPRLIVRNARISDLDGIVALSRKIYKPAFPI